VRGARTLGLTLVWLSSSSCGDTGRAHLRFKAIVVGSAPRDVDIEGATLRLSEARVSFGPLYLCATENASSELCETAIAELLDTHEVDALDPDDSPLATLEGTTGTVRSAFFDYGISWLLGSSEPRANRGSAGGHSAVLSFDAEGDDGARLRVRAALDILPIAPGDAAANGQRVVHSLRDERDELVVTLDPSAWLTRIRYDELVALDDDGDAEVTLSPGTQAYEAILVGMTANAPVRLSFR
jgi:hypothetical protein